jgi:hypothetical protein
MRLLWLAIVVVHLAVVFGNVAAFFVLPFVEPWYTALPLMSVILLLTFTKGIECPLTTAENAVRRRMGWKPIGGFIGYYILRPIRQWNASSSSCSSRLPPP